MNNYFILLAAGTGKRFNSKIPKQYTIYKNIEMFKHSINKAEKSKLFKKIILVINKNHKKFINDLNNKSVKIIVGGSERHLSSYRALNYIKKFKPNNVFIHDAARPNFSLKLLNKLNNSLYYNRAVVPYINSTDTAINVKKGNQFYLNKKNIILTQTPQCYNFNFLYKYFKKNLLMSDESSMLIKQNFKIKFIKGENSNHKITFNHNKLNNLYFGIGFDLHRLEIGKKFYIGGIKIKSKFGTVGHSDGDPVLHSLIDSILGASGLKDIGEMFPNKSSKYKGIRSTLLLKKVMEVINKNNIIINNIDINIITETPKINKYKKKIIKNISKICELDEKKINVKGKTAEKLGIIGKEKAIACEVITSLFKYDWNY